MRAPFGAPISTQLGALIMCGLLVVSCASGATQKPYAHPKSRKIVGTQSVYTPPVKSRAATNKGDAGQTIAPSAVVPAVVPALAPAAGVPSAAISSPSPPPPSPPPLPPSASMTPPARPMEGPPPKAEGPAAIDLPSEIPARAPRRDVPTWNTPPSKAPPARAQLPKAPPLAPSRPVAVATPKAPIARQPDWEPPAVVRDRPIIAPRAVVSVPAPAEIPVPAEIPAPRSVVTAPPPQTPTNIAVSSPVQSARTTNTPLVITRPTGSVEARLPCNRGASPHCDLRIYQVNVGTFVDGSTEHNPIGGYGPGPHTGDIEGVIGALDHIKALGFNTIWLTPIFDTAAGQPQSRLSGPPQVNTRLDGTGYFPRDYFKIDPQFGTLEQTQALVEQAHVLGLKVMFDGVFGHNKGGVVASPSGALPVDATSASFYDGSPANYPGRIVDFTDPRSTAFYKEAARYWIDTLGIDGWRLDQVYQVPAGPLRDITAEITAASNAQLLSGYTVGEMWGTAEQIRTVLGPSNNPALASAFDFPTRYALVQTLASDENGGTGKPASTINEAWALGAHATYPDHAIMNLMLGNHDLVRFGDLIERAGKGGPTSPQYWAIHKMAFTFMAAWSGPITLYYGEEIGAEVEGFSAKVTGDCAAANQCDDHVARNMVSIPGVNTRVSASTAQSRDLKTYLTSLMSVRAANPALSSGSRTHIFSDNHLYIDLKTRGDDRYVLVMNTGSAPRQLTLRPPAVGMISLTTASVIGGQTRVETTPSGLVVIVPPLGAAIIKLEGS